MRRASLSTILITINLGVLLLAVSGIAFAAVQLLQRLADEQALARVAQAGMIARQEVDNEHNAVLTSAQLLAERPTLRRLLAQNDVAELTAFLDRFQQTSQLDGCAVWYAGRLIASDGAAVPWDALWSARTPDRQRFVLLVAAEQPLILAAWRTIPTEPDAVVVVARQLDAELAQQIGEDIGLPITFLAGTPNQPSVDPARAALRMEAHTRDDTASARIDALHNYVAVVPLRAPSGEVVGLIESSLPTDGVTQSVARLIGTLNALVLGVSALAVAANFLLGRRLTRPLGTLTHAASRIGSGDLATPLPVVGGRETGTLAVTLEDMRRRLLQLTADLRRQRAEAQAILAGINEGVFTVDRERRIRYLNNQAAALLGIAPDDALGRFCGDVLNPQGTDGVRPCAEHCPIVHARFRGGARATEHLRLPDGRRRTVVITSSPAADEQQVQVLRDETETEAVRRLRDSVLANISHEFRTPLSAQLASIELLLDQLPTLTVEQTGDLVHSLQRGTLRLTQLIDNLLESARLEAGQHTIRHHPVALDNVIEEAVELTRPLLDQRQQTLLFELPYPLPTVCGDAPRLTQVFVNLLANANKFAPLASTIQIGSTLNSGFVTLWVEDEGPGLPAMNGATLFGQFVRAHGGDPQQSGVGLGLWITKSIVERHGGAVEAYSLPAGTRICVTLPVEHHDETTRGR